MRKEKGALAIEATIAFTVFITFLFMLLAIVKISLVYITLNDATAETAKKMAGISYPLTYVNEHIDTSISNAEEYFNYEEKEIDLIEEAKKGNAVSFIDCVFTNFDSVEDLISNLKSNIFKQALTTLVDVKQNAIKGIMSRIYLDMIENSRMPIDKSKIRITYFKIPMGEKELTYAKDKIMEKTGLEASEFSKDDVIVNVEYDYSIIVPFFPRYDVTLQSIAVEKAWLKGGDHLLNAEREGIKINLLPRNVLIAPKYGVRYHSINGCWTLGNAVEVQTVTLTKACKDGYTACAVCTPGNDDDDD